MIYRHKCYEKCHNQGNFWRKSKKITLENQGLEKSEKEKMKQCFVADVSTQGKFGFIFHPNAFGCLFNTHKGYNE